MSKDLSLSCPKCLTGKFCSSECLSDHEPHNLYCEAICSLRKLEAQKQLKSSLCVTDSEKLPMKLKSRLVKLVGKKPTVNVFLDDKAVEGLWDTGSQISLMGKDYLEKNFPGVEIHSVEDFIGGEGLKLSAANQTEVSLNGVVVFSFGAEVGEELFQVPFLISPDPISSPIFGYNTIEYLVTNFADRDVLPSVLCKLITSLPSKSVSNMVNIIEAGENCNEFSEAVKAWKNVVVDPRCYQKVKCKVNVKNIDCDNKPFLFSPLEESCMESDLHVFENVDVLKRGQRFVHVMVYNPTPSSLVIGKNSV